MKYRIITIVCAIFLTSCASNNPDSTSGYSSSLEKTDVPGVDCSDIEYRNVVTDQFPEIAQACRGVIRDANGEHFIKVNAVVHNVRKNLRGQNVRRVTLDMLDANDASLRKLSLQPPRGFRFSVDGKEYTAKDLVRGAKLRMYFPTDRWEVAWNIDTATPLDTRVYVEDIDTYLVTSTLEADEAFAFDSADLTANGQSKLDEIVNSVGQFVPAISIFGYTDKLGNEAYNLDLSQRRADAAKAYLISVGVPAERITSTGRGEAQPIVVCNNRSGQDLIDCLAPNRRTEAMFVIPAVADLATVLVKSTYQKPLGEKVTVNERKSITQLEEISGAAGDLLVSCRNEIDNNCDVTQAGDGRLLGCLASSRQAGYKFSAACDESLVGVLDAVMFRRARLNAVGLACSTELAACNATPMGQKLVCVDAQPKSEDCENAMSFLSSAAF